MSKYAQLTKEERIALDSLSKSGKFNQTQIAFELGKHKSTICREITRNKDPVNGNYNYSIAHKKAKKRREDANRSRSKIKLGGEIEQYILEKLKQDWSPDQIAGRLKTQNPLKSLKVNLSHQTIYDYIYLHRPEWKKYLRIIGVKGKYRRKYGTKIREKLREEAKKKRIDIRPKVINQRTRLGDFEGDTIVGSEKVIHILTHVDRKSGYLLANKVEASAQSIYIATVSSLGKLPKSKLKSITYDNGTQFAKYEAIETKLNIPVYFAFPYHSWERGTNENTNGLLRQYYPKKSVFKDITQTDLDKVVKLLNNRPRKRLNYLTPSEVFRKRRLVAVRD